MRNYTKLMTAIAMAMLAGTAYGSQAILPDACGSDKVQFDIQKHKVTDKPAPPADGKAQIVFIETVTKVGSGNTYLFVKTDFTTRLGMDGAWLGATGANSYFTADIAPGKHELCTAVQGQGKNKAMIGITSFTAEAGKTYYYQFLIDMAIGLVRSSSLTMIEENEGKFGVKSSELSEFKAQH